MGKKTAKNYIPSRKWLSDQFGSEWEWTEPDGTTKVLPEVLFWTGLFNFNIFGNTRLHFKIFFRSGTEVQ